ncbi:SGNH/GDSL hydrolase family protein [Mycetocola zhadangensis]|uniref:SGNH/GDSL hydrolase family protein n=2 Tax=Mycetocola zhadangensis TaxID=1164595 RepID=A0A3L7ISM1_9MICO|nr:SGNH/GDSL hydrolase family protein [Mycetocola zhadangensis]
MGICAVTGCSAAAPENAGPLNSSPGQTVAAFYGDSYTRGTGASDPSRRWSTVIAEERNWAEFNPSVDGLGFVNNRQFIDDDLVELIVAEKPDVLIVTMGLNDNFAMPARSDDIEAAISDDLNTFADELPNTRLVVVEPFWYTDERPASVGTVIDWVRDAADAVDADYIPGASRWLSGHPEWMAADGIHPNDEGYARIAERMDAALDNLGL